MMRGLWVGVLLAASSVACAQWQMQDSHSMASFRGVDYVGNSVAWVSGTNGTVLRTVDMGKMWTQCAVAPGAEKLDFRGVQAFDAQTAIVMSSGTGDLSRLYKTTDGCKSWKLVFTNPDKDGFWDAVVNDPTPVNPPGMDALWLLGDPVHGSFPIWDIQPESQRPDAFERLVKAKKGEAAFAASNSCLLVSIHRFWLATGGPDGARVVRNVIHAITDEWGWVTYPSAKVPVGSGTQSSGIFSLAGRSVNRPSAAILVAVGGDYERPGNPMRTAAWSRDGGSKWTASKTLPHGYRSAVAYDEKLKMWITVGPNGTDVSFDDGRNWKALRPAEGDAAGADKEWNALSLPFVVGPKGRIGILRESAVMAAK